VGSSAGQVYDRAVQMLEDFKHYYTSHGQVVYENPSSGNKQGGLLHWRINPVAVCKKAGVLP